MKTKIMTYNPEDFKAGKFKVPKCLKGKLPKGVKTAAEISALFEHNFSMMPSFWALAKTEKVRKPNNIRVGNWHFNVFKALVEFAPTEKMPGGFYPNECRKLAKWLSRAAYYLEARKK